MIKGFLSTPRKPQATTSKPQAWVAWGLLGVCLGFTQGSTPSNPEQPRATPSNPRGLISPQITRCAVCFYFMEILISHANLEICVSWKKIDCHKFFHHIITSWLNFLHSNFPFYRVSQVSCNIKNRLISASTSSNQFLKKDLWRSVSALFVSLHFNFKYWIIAVQKNIKWLVTLSGKLSIS